MMQYDLRAAEKAIKEMHKQPINGRVVDVHYSLPKDEDLNSKTCDRTKNQVCYSGDSFCKIGSDSVC